MHYEIERAGAASSPDVGTHAEPERWHVVNVFGSEVVPTPLTFDTLDRALAYVAQTPGTLRVIEVTDEGERVPVDKCSSADVSLGLQFAGTPALQVGSCEEVGPLPPGTCKVAGHAASADAHKTQGSSTLTAGP